MVDAKEPSMRHFFVLLVTECAAPLGMENGTIEDSQINASSAYHTDYSGPEKARLHMKEEQSRDGYFRVGWLPNTNDKNQWLQINLTQVMNVTKIATQGGYYYYYNNNNNNNYNNNNNNNYNNNNNNNKDYQWVTSFSLSYRVDDNSDYHDYQNNKVRTWTLSTNCK